ncbi:hypothetical protein Y1Q_0022097 [Alligator mississippiensis]|uniref:Uncharacterized protein n=1 Tax=Alligator mississippiensis TaxID=8496 RepID=A0A151M4N0_ALLMI|nr:hypothetical protein Y1Q_0022097 [Alligator mississippiensis]
MVYRIPASPVTRVVLPFSISDVGCSHHGTQPDDITALCFVAPALQLEEGITLFLHSACPSGVTISSTSRLSSDTELFVTIFSLH